MERIDAIAASPKNPQARGVLSEERAIKRPRYIVGDADEHTGIGHTRSIGGRSDHRSIDQCVERVDASLVVGNGLCGQLLDGAIVRAGRGTQGSTGSNDCDEGHGDNEEEDPSNESIHGKDTKSTARISSLARLRSASDSEALMTTGYTILL